ncbi:MAG: prepilin-type N-terminal cleavage/methylation domain-containing protein [Kiritimatiellae bacterium]|jgi:prepilin-type N-terminal cleavage/methylation domain-containing protein|nr:prepilin-type N-terminal cleavage/methylation domain-containing protein [Kiritimatiellia bacterium]
MTNNKIKVKMPSFLSLSMFKEIFRAGATRLQRGLSIKPLICKNNPVAESLRLGDVKSKTKIKSKVGVRSRAGLTLIEVLLAVIILSVSLTALLVASSRCIAVMTASKNYQSARWLLQLKQLEHPILYDTIEEIEDVAVPAETDENGFTFERIVEDDDDEDDLYLVKSVVSWTRKGYTVKEDHIEYIWFVSEEDEDAYK